MMLIRRIAVRRNEHEAADRLRAGGGLLRKQAGLRVRAAEMDHDRRAFGEHAAVLSRRAWDLPQRVELEELDERLVACPRSACSTIRCGAPMTSSAACVDAEPRAFLAVERVHRSSPKIACTALLFAFPVADALVLAADEAECLRLALRTLGELGVHAEFVAVGIFGDLR